MNNNDSRRNFIKLTGLGIAASSINILSLILFLKIFLEKK